MSWPVLISGIYANYARQRHEECGNGISLTRSKAVNPFSQGGRLIGRRQLRPGCSARAKTYIAISIFLEYSIVFDW
jgi:hypothetical protein